MSINFTSDITGATSGSGLTKIVIGDKTINLSETTSGTSGGYASGSITPDATTNTLTINTGLSSVSGFLLYLAETPSEAVGYRYTSEMFADFVREKYRTHASNNAGSIPIGNVTYVSYVSVTGGNISIDTSSAPSTIGVFTTSAYNWIAW